MSHAFQRSAIALALASLSSLAVAAGPDARARGQIEAYAGYTLHGEGHAYAVRDVVTDADGGSHVRFDRRVQGLRVIGGDLVVHADRNGSFRGASHTLRHVIDGKGKHRINPNEAVRAALAAHAGDAQGAERVIYARGDAPALAYEVMVFSEQSDGTPSEKHVIVDGFSGAVLEAWDDIHTGAAAGTGKSYFSGNVALTTNSISGGYELRDPSRGGQYTVDMKNKKGGNGGIFTDTDNTWGNNALTDAATIGVDAQYGTAVTWDYYLNVHGRSGIANDGKGAYNRVHYGRNYSNAYWSDSCFCMTYGDGDGTTFNPFDSLDVAGHEMTHGVTSRSANLVYNGESGGLNEATSDIFGTMVEFHANNANDPGDYLIGEKLYKSGTKSLRYMFQPSKDGASADCWYSNVGTLDVHYSSGVANHWFYLLAEGTGGNGFGASKTCQAGDTKTATGTGTLAGIGRDKAAKIWYRALTVYLTSSSKYVNARAAALSAAADLYGAGSAEVNATAAAWSAVNVN